jgi:hypothetical protein
MTWRHWLAIGAGVAIFVVVSMAVWALFGALCQVYLTEFCEAL